MGFDFDAVAVPDADSTENIMMRDSVGNKTDTAVTTSGTTKSIMAYIKGAITELTEILNLTRTGANIAVTLSETSLFIDEPSKIIAGRDIAIRCNNMGAGDTYEFASHYRIEEGADYDTIADPAVLSGVQVNPLYIIKLRDYRYGCKITARKIAGTDRSFYIEAIREA